MMTPTWAFISGALFCFVMLLCYGLTKLQKKQAPSPAQPATHPCTVMHDYAVVGAQAARGVDSPVTIVLKQCRICNWHAHFHYAGDWKLEDLLRKETDQEKFERGLFETPAGRSK